MIAKKTIYTGIITIIVVAIAGMALMRTKAKHANDTQGAIPVTTAKVKTQSIANTIDTTGTLSAIHQANISAKVSGYIKTLNIKEGQHVTQNQVLLTLDATSEKDQLLEDKADMSLAKLNLDRNAKLIKKGDISPAMMDQLKATYSKAKAAYDAQLTQVNDKTLNAPFSGTIGASTMNVGDYVQAGTALVSLTDTHELRVDYTLSAKYINNVKLGQSVTITGPNHLHAKAYVSFISPSIDSDTQTFAVHATLDNSQAHFHPGQYVKITQALGQNANALLIPLVSVVYSISGSNVYSVKNHHVIEIPVKLGATIGNHVVVVQGLSAKQSVITQGVNEIRPGTEVKITT